MDSTPIALPVATGFYANGEAWYTKTQEKVVILRATLRKNSGVLENGDVLTHLPTGYIPTFQFGYTFADYLVGVNAPTSAGIMRINEDGKITIGGLPSSGVGQTIVYINVTFVTQ